MSVTTAKAEDIYRAQQILVQKTNNLLTPENVQIHSQGAAFLLVWAANFIKLYATTKWLGKDLALDGGAKTSYKIDDFNKITL